MKASSDFESILDQLDECIETLSSGESVSTSSGWTRENRLAMVQLLRGWRAQIAASERLKPEHHRSIVRWFMDNDVDVDDVGKEIVRIDNRISRSTKKMETGAELAEEPTAWRGLPRASESN